MDCPICGGMPRNPIRDFNTGFLFCDCCFRQVELYYNKNFLEKTLSTWLRAIADVREGMCRSGVTLEKEMLYRDSKLDGQPIFEVIDNLEI